MTFFLFLPLLYIVHGQTRARGYAPAKGRARAVSNVVCVLFVAAALLWSRRTGVSYFARDPLVPGRFPEGGADFLERVHLLGHMFNPVDWGGYLSYRLYPEYRTLGDGRWNLISRAVVLDSERVLARSGDVEEIFDRYGTDFLIEPLAYYLRSAPLLPDRWVLAYHDAVSVILLRRTENYIENLRQTRSFYAAEPELRPHAAWQIVLRAGPGAITPLSVPSALNVDAER